MRRDEQLDDLLDRWQQCHEDGQPISPEELCRDHPELLETIRERIEAIARVQGLMTQSFGAPTPPLPGAELHQTLGDTLVGLAALPQAPPGYEIHGELGRGGVGVVYKAKQVGLNRLVALKMLLTGAHAGVEDRKRFRLEAEAIARLQHSNIVQVYEVGEHHGRPFLALEYVPGGSLADRLRQQPLTPGRAAELVRTLAAAVQVAHEANVVHRDLKPANVLLSAGEVPKISDFGLAKKLDDDGANTRSGALMGTPAYMSPEQARGSTHEIGPVTDVYALGVILYECLTGQVPFRAATMFDLMALVQHAEPVPPRRFNGQIPRDLETICLRCLRKESGKRYPSAKELVDDLDRYLAGEPIRARPVGRTERALRWARRNRALAALYAVSTVAIVALLGAGFWVSARLGAARVEHDIIEARAAAAEIQAQAEREHARAADRLTQSQRFFTLLTQAREGIANPQPGSTWKALDALARAAQLPDAASHLTELRTETLSCLGAIDLRLRHTVKDTPRVQCVAWHPGGKWLALGERSGGFFAPCRVTLIDPQRPDRRESLLFAQKRVFTAEGKLGPDIVRALSFSHDGRRLAAGMRSGMLHVWDLTVDPPKLTSWQAHKGDIMTLRFARDSKAIFVRGELTLRRWDLARNAETALATAQGDPLSLDQHPTEGWVAVSEYGRVLRLHPETLKPVAPPLNTDARLFAISPDGRTMVLSRDRGLSLWHVAGDRLVQRFRAQDREIAHEHGIADLAISPDGTLLASSDDVIHHVALWDLVSGRQVAGLPIGAGESKLAFAPDGRSLAVLGHNQTLIYELAGRRELSILARQPTAIQSFAMAGDAVACVSEGPKPEHGEIVFWSKPAAARPPDRIFPFGPWQATSSYPAALSPDGRWLATLGVASPHVYLNDTTVTTSYVATPASEGRSLMMGPDGRLWAAAGEQVRAWEVPSLKPWASWKNSLGMILRGVSAMRNVVAGRRWVVAAGQDGTVVVFPARPGDLTVAHSRSLTQAPLRGLAMSPDEQLALVGAETGERWLLRLPSAEIVAELARCDDGAEVVAWAANDLVACGCRNGKVTVFRRAGEQLRELFTLRHGRSLRGMRFDGRRLAVLLAGERGVRVWHLDRAMARLAELGLGER